MTSLRLTSEEVLLAAGGKMGPMTVQTPSEALKLSLLMMMKHTADVHLTVLEIIAEKYKLDLDEMLDTVKDHPRWQAILQTPLISDLTANAVAHTVQPPKEVAVKKKTVAAPKPAAKVPAASGPPAKPAPKVPVKIADEEEEVYE